MSIASLGVLTPDHKKGSNTMENREELINRKTLEKDIQEIESTMHYISDMKNIIKAGGKFTFRDYERELRLLDLKLNRLTDFIKLQLK